MASIFEMFNLNDFTTRELEAIKVGAIKANGKHAKEWARDIDRLITQRRGIAILYKELDYAYVGTSKAYGLYEGYVMSEDGEIVKDYCVALNPVNDYDEGEDVYEWEHGTHFVVSAYDTIEEAKAIAVRVFENYIIKA